jgi:hypothetical protein
MHCLETTSQFATLKIIFDLGSSRSHGEDHGGTSHPTALEKEVLLLFIKVKLSHNTLIQAQGEEDAQLLLDLGTKCC